MMTVNQLHKILAKQIEDGHGTRPVAVDLATFPSVDDQDGAIAGVESGSASWVAESDGDGFIVTNADGSERGQTMFVLGGE